jgi:hypothetical protein
VTLSLEGGKNIEGQYFVEEISNFWRQDQWSCTAETVVRGFKADARVTLVTADDSIQVELPVTLGFDTRDDRVGLRILEGTHPVEPSGYQTPRQVPDGYRMAAVGTSSIPSPSQCVSLPCRSQAGTRPSKGQHINPTATKRLIISTAEVFGGDASITTRLEIRNLAEIHAARVGLETLGACLLV